LGISGALVILARYPENNATTLADGSYIIGNVPFGTYDIAATAAGYMNNVNTVDVTGAVVKDFSLTTGNVTGDYTSPPVNQNYGIYDTLMMNYNETLCRGCHNSTSSPLMIGGVPTRHHNLVRTSAINPSTNQPFQCTDCHPSTPGVGTGMLLERNCMNCHNSTPFWGNSLGAHVSNFTRPHHNTTQAQIRNCKFCHGASVDNYDDGHYIPSYPPSEVTPNAMYKAYNTTSMRVWGGCLACHKGNAAATPSIYYTSTVGFPPVADGKNNVHHNEIFTVTQGAQCVWCHVDASDIPNIRGCETCHSVRSIHNIQYEYIQNGPQGKGHINNDSDCMGCHAWYDAGDADSFAGAVISDVQSVTPAVFTANTPTVITLTGSNFVQTGSTTVVNIDDTTNITPDTITNDQITVTVNLAAGNHYIKVIKTDSLENVPKPSGIRPLTVVIPVDAVTAKITRIATKKAPAEITITGTGLGPQLTPQNDPLYLNHGVWIKIDGKSIKTSIVSWTDTKIVVTTPNANEGNPVTVMALSGGDTEIIGGVSTPTPTPTPTKTPKPPRR
jgi:IPT/TIG domain